MLDISSIIGFIDQVRVPMFTKAVLDTNTAKNFTLMTEVKHKANLNLLETLATADDAKRCGWGGFSNQTASAREITVNNLKYEIGYCVEKLVETWMSYNVRVADGSKLPFEEQFILDFVNNVQVDADRIVWQGEQGQAGAQTDGILTMAIADADVVKIDVTAAGTTKYAQVKDLVKAIPAAELRGECRIYCSPEFLTGYHMELVDLNLYHYEAGKDIEEIQVPGSSVILTSVVGLTGAKYLVASNKNNVVYATDYDADAKNFKAWYSENDDEVRIRIKFNAGAQYAFSDRIVLAQIEA